jgi:hypothetical protein
MSQVQYVAPNNVYGIWDKVEPYIVEALKHSGGEYSAEYLKTMIIEGRQVLLVAVNEQNEIHGVCTVEFANYPNDRIAYVTAFGGVNVANKDIWGQFETWLKLSGATKFRASTYASAARLYRRAFGTIIKYIVVEKAL